MAILRVHTFLLERRAKAGYSITPVSWARAGWTHSMCSGCIIVSLDLSNAFDKVNRAKLVEALYRVGLSESLAGAIRAWYQHPDYILRIGELFRKVATTRGVRQGCTLAPLLWVIYLYCIIDDLCVAHPSVDWLSLLTAYADDLILCFPVDVEGDVPRACSAIAFFIDFLSNFGLEINIAKTQVLFRLVGKASRRVLAKHTRNIEGGRRLKVSEQLLLPIKEEIEYLGIKLSWQRCSDSIVLHRIQRGRRAFAMLHQWWRMPLSLALKIKLFNVMVIPVFSYGVCSGGLSDKGAYLLRKEVMRCLRRLAKSPAHITHESDACLLSRLGVLHPHLRIQVSCCQLLRRMMQTLHSEVCPSGRLTQLVSLHASLNTSWWKMIRQGLSLLFPTTPVDFSYVGLRSFLLSVGKEKLSLIQAKNKNTPAVSQELAVRSYVCEGCGRSFFNYNRLRSHQFHARCAWNRDTAVFTPAFDCRIEEPTCYWCKRSFLWWSGLETHINKGQCEQLPLRRAQLLAVSDRRAPPPALHIEKDMTCHCVICGRWVPLTRSLSNHIKFAHQVEFQRAMTAYRKADLSTVKFRHICPFCNAQMSSTGNMRTHVRSHCLVLLQRFIAGYPHPLNPESPDTPVSEQTYAYPRGHGEECSDSARAIPASRRTTQRGLGRSSTEASQACQIKRRLRGKQADPRCRHALVQQAGVHQQARTLPIL